MGVRLALLIVCAAGAACAADTVVIPYSANTAGGAGSYNLVFNQQAASYLVVYGSAELAPRLPAGSQITGISWRNASWLPHPSWPPATTTFQNFDIYIGPAARSPGQLVTSNAMNNVGAMTLARWGPLTLSPGFLPGGAMNPTPNPFAATIPLTVPYIYNGGDLAIMVRHTGNNIGSADLDWIASYYGAVGAQAIGIQSYTQNTGWSTQGHSGGLSILFTYDTAPPPPPPPCYANCDGSTSPPLLTTADFACFLQRFAIADPYTNCDGSTTSPVLNIADFVCFLQRFAEGCP